jgi:hypothetical protein
VRDGADRRRPHRVKSLQTKRRATSTSNQTMITSELTRLNN